MVRNTLLSVAILIMGIACARPEQRAARYDKNECPICSHITNGTCSYCNGSGHCMYCQGNKERLTVSPNIMDDSDVKPFHYLEPCPFCKSTGVCQYCNGTGKCWACNGTAKVGEKWDCLDEKVAAK